MKIIKNNFNRILLTKSDIAREFEVHRNTVYKRIEEAGILPRRKIRNADVYYIYDVYKLFI